MKIKSSYTADKTQIGMMEAKAKIRQAFLNYLKGELRLKQKCRKSVRDAYFQYGVVKVHFHADLMENEPIYAEIYNSQILAYEEERAREEK